LLRCEPVRSHLCELQAIEFVCVGDVPNTTSCMCSTRDRASTSSSGEVLLFNSFKSLWFDVVCGLTFAFCDFLHQTKQP
jgi:hypothetical protein